MLLILNCSVTIPAANNLDQSMVTFLVYGTGGRQLDRIMALLGIITLRADGRRF